MAFEGVHRGKHWVSILERSERPFARPFVSFSHKIVISPETLERPSARTWHGSERLLERFLSGW